MARHRRDDDLALDEGAVVGPSLTMLDGGAPPDGAGGGTAELAAKPGTGVEPAAKPNRAGRNLPAAIGIGVLLGAVVVTMLFAYRPSMVYLICLAVGYAIIELTLAVRATSIRPPVVPLVVGGIAMQAAAWFRGPSGLVMGLFITACAVAIWRLAEGARGYLDDLAAASLWLLYVPFLGGFVVLLTHPSDGAARVLLFAGAVVCSDTGGYAVGVLFGRHPLAPTVSKGKTWQGFGGSLATCALCGALIMRFTFHHPWWQGALFGLAIALTATLGDLGESMIKRDLGIKDMGRLLPGHGGLMDRLDSLLPCAAVSYLLLAGFLG
ncbi:MAG: phosphatidate cytidylyltransferase [Actinomycetia bacterium]|nr:phosphatidate cytidylyltransferase [Actinomycetes bacterium]